MRESDSQLKSRPYSINYVNKGNPMPFHEKFREFQIKTDIIFGLTTPDRNEFLTFLKLRPKDRSRLGNPLFIDGFDNLNQEIGFKESKAIPTENRNKHRLAVLDAYPEAESKHATDNALDRKKSKGSLYWAARNGIHLHFVMHALATSDSQTRIVKKTSNKGGGPGPTEEKSGDVPKGKNPVQFNLAQFESDDYWNKYRQVTGSELRWIYRMRENEKVKNFVQFWRSENGKEFEQCPPPWEWDNWCGTNYKKIWNEYKPTMEGAYDSLLSEGSV